MTFDEVCKIAKATPKERDEAAWFLAQFRAKKIYEELRFEPSSPLPPSERKTP